MRLLALCACEKVIIDKNGAHSLVTLMLRVELSLAVSPSGLPLDQEIPTNAVIPRDWSVFTMWAPDPADIGKSFEEVYQIFWPSGEKFSEHRLGFKFEDGVQQVSLTVFGLPIGQLGNLKIVTWLEQDGRPVTDQLDYLIQIKHKPAQAPSSTSLSANR